MDVFPTGTHLVISALSQESWEGDPSGDADAGGRRRHRGPGSPWRLRAGLLIKATASDYAIAHEAAACTKLHQPTNVTCQPGNMRAAGRCVNGATNMSEGGCGFLQRCVYS